jgi:chromosome segregation ATPase
MSTLVIAKMEHKEDEELKRFLDLKPSKALLFLYNETRHLDGWTKEWDEMIEQENHDGRIHDLEKKNDVLQTRVQQLDERMGILREVYGVMVNYLEKTEKSISAIDRENKLLIKKVFQLQEELKQKTGRVYRLERKVKKLSKPKPSP